MAGKAVELAPGDRVGSLRIVEEIGRGAFGRVYRAVDEAIGRDVALKVVGGLDLDEARWALIEREIRVLGRLNHPNIVTLHHLHTDQQGRRMLEMEYVEGRDLGEQIELQGALAPDAVLGLAAALCSALGAAHAQGIIHRDVKPGNVLLGNDGRIKLADFGLGREQGEATLSGSSGALVGTPHYMAPELLDHQPARVASDLWSLGVLLFCALTGKPPFQGETLPSLFFQIHAAVPPPLGDGVPSPLRRAVAWCLQRDPDARPPDAAALARLLRDEAPLPVPRPAAPVLEARRRLHGRSQELAALRDALADVAEGRSSQLLLTGEEGVGLGALLEEARHMVVERGGTGFHVRVDRVVGLRRGLADCLRPGADVAAGGDAAAITQLAVETFRAHAPRAPLLLAIEDLHQGNADDAAMLEHLLRAVQALPVFVLVSSGPAAADTGSGRGFRLPDLPSLRVRAVAPLDEESADRLLVDFWAPRAVDARVRRTLVRRAGGLPRLLVELAREAATSGRVRVGVSRVDRGEGWDDHLTPPRVREVALQRLRGLDDEAREALETGAIVGQSFEAELVAHALDTTPIQVLRRLQRVVRDGGWLRSAGQGFTFESGVVRDVLYAAVVPPLRAEIHRIVAERLAAGPEDDPVRLEALAGHWLACGRTAAARAAAREAIVRLPRGETIRTIQLAQRVGLLDPALPVEELRDALTPLCRTVSCLIDAGQFEEADGVLRRLEALGEGDLDTVERAEVALRRAAWVQWKEGAHALAGVDLEGIARALVGTESGRQALYLKAVHQRDTSDLRAAESGLVALAEASQSAGDVLGLARAQLAAAGVARARRRLDEARGLYLQARALFDRLHHAINVAVCDVNLAMVSLGGGAFAEARERLDAALLALDRLGARRLAEQAQLVRCDIDMACGAYEDARRRVQRLAAVASRSVQFDCHLLAGRASGLLGDTPSGAASLASARALLGVSAEPGEWQSLLLAEALQATRAAGGDARASLADLDRRLQDAALTLARRLELLVRAAQLVARGADVPPAVLRAVRGRYRDLAPARRRDAVRLARYVRQAHRSRPGSCDDPPDASALLGQDHAELQADLERVVVGWSDAS